MGFRPDPNWPIEVSRNAPDVSDLTIEAVNSRGLPEHLSVDLNLGAGLPVIVKVGSDVVYANDAARLLGVITKAEEPRR